MKNFKSNKLKKKKLTILIKFLLKTKDSQILITSQIGNKGLINC